MREPRALTEAEMTKSPAPHAGVVWQVAYMCWAWQAVALNYLAKQNTVVCENCKLIYYNITITSTMRSAYA